MSRASWNWAGDPAESVDESRMANFRGCVVRQKKDTADSGDYWRQVQYRFSFVSSSVASSANSRERSVGVVDRYLYRTA